MSGVAPALTRVASLDELLALVMPDHQGWGLESPGPQHLKH